MHGRFDQLAINAAFAQPDIEGRFDGAFADYLQAVSASRPIVLFAFPPKAAGTFLRTAAIHALNGQHIRSVHAQGGRDAQFYLPAFLAYYSGTLGDAPMVTHVHMQALPANRHFIETLDLDPVIMLRPIPDMLRSFNDMMLCNDRPQIDALNTAMPGDYAAFAHKADFLVDFVAPWYASYYATWLEWAQEQPERICILRYADFRERPAHVLGQALAHGGVLQSESDCVAAIAQAWGERRSLRFHRGEHGRGQDFFNADQHARIARMLSYFPVLDEWRAELLPPRA
jgi:hypothetical protein